MFKILSTMKKIEYPPDVYSGRSYLRVEPTFKGSFENLSPERSEELDRFSTQGKADILDQRTAEEDGLLSYEDLSEKTGKSLSYLRQLCSLNRIKPKKKIRQVAYFDPGVVDLVGVTNKKEKKNILEAIKK